MEQMRYRRTGKYIHLKTMVPYIILSLLIKVCLTQTTGSSCTSIETSEDCVNSDLRCAWCSQEDFIQNGGNRCDSAENLRGRCTGDYIEKRIQGPPKRNDQKLSSNVKVVWISKPNFDNMICEYGICKCLPGWAGNGCNCRDTNETCLARNGVLITSTTSTPSIGLMYDETASTFNTGFEFRASIIHTFLCLWIWLWNCY